MNLVLSPVCVEDLSLAIAACRAGGVGVVDLEFAGNTQIFGSLSARLKGLATGAAGVRVGWLDRKLARSLLTSLAPEIGLVLVPAARLAELAAPLRHLRARGVRVLAEITAGADADLVDPAAVDGLVARGSEVGGFSGDESTFILVQRLADRGLPLWAHGGIGLHSAAACRVAGLRGVVLDGQLSAVRESAIPRAVRDAVSRMDGSETVRLGEELGAPFRAYARPNLPVLDELRRLAATLRDDPRPLAERQAAWRRAVAERVGWGDAREQLWPLGPDAAQASGLANRFGTVGGVLEALDAAADEHVRVAAALRPLDRDAPLARSHRTAYPILQGPMTRVSDVPAFAAAVAHGGGLPFLALALLREAEVRRILQETKRQAGDAPWGVGILGFVPLELRQEQLAVVREIRPPFALIAGGRPDQARTLEEEGIATYLHVPSPGLLKLFVEQGARRFVFEGRECGGHVGPRSSFVLWNAAVEVLLEAVPAGAQAEAFHVVFAGGIHDAASAAMVAALAAPLAARGVKIGVLLGTGYLFTHEAVATGAIMPAFQDEAVRCRSTVLLETGPGHSTRCATTHFAEVFESERRRLERDGASPEHVREALEALNLGRLRIASKGVAHDTSGQARRVTVPEAEQRREGMYMIGQLATLRDRVCSVAELHEDVAVGGTARLLAAVSPDPVPSSTARPCDVAVIGMSCFLPKAPDIDTYWANILGKVDAITEIPRDRFDWERYFDPDPAARDKIYSRWGGFVDPVAFDAGRFGIAPTSLTSIEPVQLIVLEAVRRALDDAGYASRAFPRARTGVIVGVGGGVGDLGNRYGTRAALPIVAPDAGPEAYDRLPEWTEDSFAGIIANVTAGRVANRFDLRGVNYTVDAACASALAALYAGVRELESRNADVMIVAGADTVQNPFGYLCFSKTRALSPHGRCRAFDEAADGTVISEGVVVVVLKRLADAERDGDRIYAVIKSVAGASDGRGLSMTAPSPDGQVLTLERAYDAAGISPASVQLVEAHGTGTVAGDQAEISALSRVFAAADPSREWCGVGSVKSMIGHTKCAAGLAGLVKAVKAVHHGVLPPTLGVERPNAKARFGEGPLYVSSEARPWLRRDDGPRRAGVSAFGFGGTNFHAVVEEYRDRLPCDAHPATLPEWPAELVLIRAAEPAGLAAAVAALAREVDASPAPRLAAVARAAWERARPFDPATCRSLAVVATSLDDLRAKLAAIAGKLDAGATDLDDPSGTYLVAEPLARDGRVAFLFPGQGSQHVDMLRDLALHFDEVRAAFEVASATLAGKFPSTLGSYVFPPPRFDAAQRQADEAALRDTHVAQPALGAADLGVCRLLETLGVRPDAVAGHSYGEYVALAAAGAIDEPTLYRLSEARGRAIVDTTGDESGTMAAVAAGRDAVEAALADASDVWVANLNGPRQTVVAGTRRGIQAAVERLTAAGLTARPIPVACGFHSPLMAEAARRFADDLDRAPFVSPRIPVFSNTTAAPHDAAPGALVAALGRHLESPVRFADEIEAMHAWGVRILVEVGPKNVLTGLAQQALGERRFAAIATDVPGRHGLAQLMHALGRLAAHGVAVQLDRLFAGRSAEARGAAPASATTWLVNGGGVRPLDPRMAPARPSRPAAAVVAAPAGTAPQLAAGGMLAAAATAHGTTAAGNGASAASNAVYAGNGASAAHDGAATGTNGGPPAAGYPMPPAGAHSLADVVQGQAADAVMAHFQRTMGRFLEVQRNVMLAYLGADGAQPVAMPSDAGTWSPAVEAVPVHVPVASAPPAAVPARGAGDGHAAGVPSPSTDGVHHAVEPAANGAQAVPPSPTLDRTAVMAILLRIASDRTGYPPDMLDLDAGLEADLGIDSIKRVEILGALQEALPPEVAKRLDDGLEQLTRAKSLRAIVEQLPLDDAPASAGGAAAARVPAPVAAAASAAGTSGHAPVDGTPSAQAAPAFADASAAEAPEPDRVPRCVVVAVDAPVEAGSPVLPGGPVLVTDDAHGAAAAVVAALQAAGARAVLIPPPADEAEAAAAVERARAGHGRVGGIVHLAALAPAPPLDALDVERWQARIRRDVRSLFLLGRAAAADLAATRDAVVIGVTSLGGTFGCEGLGPEAFAVQGGVAGLVKTMGVEWPQVRCRALDLVRDPAPDTVATRVLAELGIADGEQEVGWAGDRRVVIRARPAPFPPANAQLALEPGAVIVVTGGARGITSRMAEEVARRWHPRLVLVGRLPAPAADEGDTAGLESPRDLKAAIIARMRLAGRSPSPVEVEGEYRRLLRDREQRQRIAAIAAAGATVDYRSADVRDPKALAALLDDVYRTYGRVDGVIHGAGVIEDKLLAEKSLESFDRVLETKAMSAFVLASTLRPGGLRFLAFFSSVAGRWGNRGQGDYCAANEIMNKLAAQLDGRWPGRVVALDWGPWAGSGMVSEGVAKQFAERGVVLVPPNAGARSAVAEIEGMGKGTAEVVFGGGPWEQLAAAELAAEAARNAQAGAGAARADAGSTNGAGAAGAVTDAAAGADAERGAPLLAGVQPKSRGGGTVEVEHVFDPERDVYLLDHVLDGKPVVPAAVMAGLMAETVQQGWADWHVTGLSDFRVLRGVVLSERTRAVRIVARAQTHAPSDDMGLEVDVEIRELAPARAVYRATAHLAPMPVPPPMAPPLNVALRPFPLPLGRLYREWLFHGPRFQCIAALPGMGQHSLHAVLRASDPAQVLRRPGRGGWCIDPVLLDGGLQLALLWTRATWDMSALPAGFQRLSWWGGANGHPVECRLDVHPESTGHTATFDVLFVRSDGRLLARLEGLRSTGSRALNRLMGWREGPPAVRFDGDGAGGAAGNPVAGEAHGDLE